MYYSNIYVEEYCRCCKFGIDFYLINWGKVGYLMYIKILQVSDIKFIVCFELF